MFEIVKADISHLHTLVQLRVDFMTELGAVNGFEETELFRKATHSYFERAFQDDSFISYILVQNSEVVSTSGLSFFNRPPSTENLSGKEAYLLNMYTIPHARKQGYANLLLERCVKHCKEEGIKRIFLHATLQGEPIYLKYGFAHKEHEMELFM